MKTLSTEQLELLRRILDYVMMEEEKRHWEELGFPENHIYYIAMKLEESLSK